jgi:hypothetical protein
VGENASVRIIASQMVTFGGTDTATDLDVSHGVLDTDGNPAVEGATITRGGQAKATGSIQITVAGGTNPLLYVNELSSLVTDAYAVASPSPGAASSITIDTDSGVQIAGVVQGLDPASDVAITSGHGLLYVSGYVEAGDELHLNGATSPSPSVTVSVMLSKLLYETKTAPAATTAGPTRNFTLDMNGEFIDSDGFLIQINGLGQVVVDGGGVPQRVVDGAGHDVLGAQPVYITYVGAHVPVLVDKQGRQLVEDIGTGKYFLVDAAGQYLDAQGRVINAAGVLLDATGGRINQYGYKIDVDGNFVDELGRAINAYGDRVDSHGNLIDVSNNLISEDGYLINAAGLLINLDTTLLNGVGKQFTVKVISSVNYRADKYGNLVSDQGCLINEAGFRINENGELIGLDGVPLTNLDSPVLGGSRVVQNPLTLQPPVAGGARKMGGSIQLGGAPKATTGPITVDLPARKSGGTLNTTGPTGRIVIVGDEDLEIWGMVGKVYMDESNPAAPKTAVHTTQVTMTSGSDVYTRSDALVNATDLVTVTGTNVWALDESVIITRQAGSETYLHATGAGPSDGAVYVARSQIYYFRALVAAQGLVRLEGREVNVFGTVQVQGDRLHATGDDLSRAELQAADNVVVRGEVLSATTTLPATSTSTRRAR